MKVKVCYECDCFNEEGLNPYIEEIEINKGIGILGGEDDNRGGATIHQLVADILQVYTRNNCSLKILGIYTT